MSATEYRNMIAKKLQKDVKRASEFNRDYAYLARNQWVNREYSERMKPEAQELAKQQKEFDRMLLYSQWGVNPLKNQQYRLQRL